MKPPDVREVIDLDGYRVTLRTLWPEDREMEAAFVRGLSPRSRRYRFHSGMRELTPVLLDRFTHVDYPSAMALVATVQEAGAERQIAVARWAPTADDPEGAEIAVVVADAWQNRGLGTRLLERLGELARAAGIPRLHANVLAENRRMLELASHLGFRVDPAAHERGSVMLAKDVTREPDTDAT